jgi:hypothetical protein
MLHVNVLVTEMPDGSLTAKVGREVGPLLAEGRMLRDSGKVPKGILFKSFSQTPSLHWSFSSIPQIAEPFKGRKIRGKE